jgi:hypothetical protein
MLSLTAMWQALSATSPHVTSKWLTPNSYSVSAYFFHFLKILILGFIFVSGYLQAQTISEFEPSRQRVGEVVSIRGSDFCSPASCNPGTVTLIEVSSSVEVPVSKIELWRDELIQFRLPSGFFGGGGAQVLPAGPFTIQVEDAVATWTLTTTDELAARRGSNAIDTLAYVQRTQIIADRDQDGVLGDPDENLGRTKDADVADLDNDGFPDIFDSNSNNDDNSTDVIVRRNTGSGSFTSTIVGPRDGFVSYDSDFADLNSDNLPDLIRTESPDGGRRISVYRNRGREDNYFDLSAPDFTANLDLCPDDIAVGDLNNDGLLDFAVTERIGNICNAAGAQISTTAVFIGQDDSFNFTLLTPKLAASDETDADSSTHDVFFLNADDNNSLDIFTVNENGVPGKLWLNDGEDSPAFTASSTVFPTSLAGGSADFNADGFDDFILAGSNTVIVFLNNSGGTPSVFSETLLSNAAAGSFYDVELGDIDLDGDIDISAVTIDGGNNGQVRIWRNNGDGSFVEFGGTDPLPGHGNYQRLSADFIDYDLDGDLDVYVAGGDGQDKGCFGCVPNQLFTNMSALNIVEPTTQLPTNVRSQDADPRILIRLQGPNLDMIPSDLQFEVDGTPFGAERIINIGRIGNENWLVFRPGQQIVAGRTCFDLRVQMTAFPELFDVEASSICYEEAAPLDRVIAIDRTTSMLRVGNTANPEKMQAAIAAGELFVDLSSSEDRFGALSFQYLGDVDDNGNVDIIPETVRIEGPAFSSLNAANRIAMRSDISNVWPTPVPPMRETSIGAPAQEALRIMNDVAILSPITRDIVLITDGKENRDPRYKADVESSITAADPPVRLHTISVGGDADDPFLQEIAESTGGTWVNLLTGEGSYFLLSRLSDIYKRIDADIRDEQRFFYREDLPPCIGLGAGCIRSDTFEVPAGLEWMTVVMHWNNPDGPTPDLPTLTLSDPSATAIAHAPPNIESYSASTHKSFRIQQPEPGTWNYSLFTFEGQEDFNSNDLEFSVVASAPSILALRAGPVDVEFLQPSGIDARMRLVLVDNAPIAGATVTAELRDPDGDKTMITFLDDGANDDGAANDGIYGHKHTTLERGAYLAYAQASGTDNSGDPFTRYTMLSFQYPKYDQPDGPEGGYPLPPGGCGCLPRAEDYSVAVFVGASEPHSSFDSIANGNTALGLQVQRQFTNTLAAGFFLGHDTFDNTLGGDDFSFTHLSAEVKYNFSNDFCPRPAIHAGIGNYEDQDSKSGVGYNVGASLGVCLNDQWSWNLRYDYRNVTDFDTEYSTLMLGLQFKF